MWTWKHHALALALAGASAGAQALDLIDVWQAAREHDAAYVALATRRAADFYAALGYEPSATYFKHRL